MESLIKKRMLTKPILLILFGGVSGLFFVLVLENLFINILQTFDKDAYSIELPTMFYFLVPLALALPAISILIRNLFLISSWKTGKSPACPKCGFPMIERKANKGQFIGQSFWGCYRYPSCQGKIHIG